MALKRSRMLNAGLIGVTILLGLLSRRIPGVPLFMGDVLWATMVFFIVQFLLIRSSLWRVTILSLLICFAVEISQLYQADWINAVRATWFGKLVLGQGFLWSDLIAYGGGIFVGGVVDILIFEKN